MESKEENDGCENVETKVMKKKELSKFPSGRIKRLMQSDDDIGKLGGHVPVLVSKAIELFLEELANAACEVAGEQEAKTLRPEHIKACLPTKKHFDFLKDVFAKVPDLSEKKQKKEKSRTSVHVEKVKPQKKRRRIDSDSDEDDM